MCSRRVYHSTHLSGVLLYWVQNDDGTFNAVHEHKVKLMHLKHKQYFSLMMEMANFKGSKFYYLNGHFFYWTFFLSRPLLILPYWLYVYEHLQNMENLLSTMSAAHLIVNLMLSVCLDCLNLYWTIFLSKGQFVSLVFVQ